MTVIDIEPRRRVQELLRAALDLAKRGWHVAPIYEPREVDGTFLCSFPADKAGHPICASPGKHPRLPRGYRPTADIDTITSCGLTSRSRA